MKIEVEQSVIIQLLSKWIGTFYARLSSKDYQKNRQDSL